jgi:hypothetical protein
MKNFAPFELVDRAIYERMGETALALFNPEALIALDDLRDFFRREITVNDWSWGGRMQWRGFRTPEKATELGAPHSQHARGNAFDCTIQGYTAAEARVMIIAHKDNPLLSRITRLEDSVSWLHFDLGELPKGKERIWLFRS